MAGVEEAEDEAPRKRGRGGVKGLCGALRCGFGEVVEGWSWRSTTGATSAGFGFYSDDGKQR